MKGLTKQKEGAQQALVELLPDKVVGKEVEKALKFSKDKNAIAPLMKYVRKAQSDYDLARRAAHSIGWIDRDWVPKDTTDCVDFLLFFYHLENIKKKLGNKALGRLDYWTKSNCTDMKKKAAKALSYYKNK